VFSLQDPDGPGQASIPPSSVQWPSFGHPASVTVLIPASAPSSSTTAGSKDDLLVLRGGRSPQPSPFSSPRPRAALDNLLPSSSFPSSSFFRGLNSGLHTYSGYLGDKASCFVLVGDPHILCFPPWLLDDRHTTPSFFSFEMGSLKFFFFCPGQLGTANL
jgi:hypothetical protein